MNLMPEDVDDDEDFYEEDEPLDDVLAAWNSSGAHLTALPQELQEQQTRGTGWCAPSP